MTNYEYLFLCSMRVIEKRLVSCYIRMNPPKTLETELRNAGRIIGLEANFHVIGSFDEERFVWIPVNDDALKVLDTYQELTLEKELSND